MHDDIRDEPATGDVLPLTAIDATHTRLVGGKAAKLGDLARVSAVRVPPGFCVTTRAFEESVLRSPTIASCVARLSALDVADRDGARALGAEIRQEIESLPLSEHLAARISRAIGELDAQAGFAVRTSATTEDLATTSGAGQHDTFLDVRGTPAVLDHVRRCWASLFTDRALVYRTRHGVDHRTARMAVLVQQMVWPRAAGVLFTADPLSGHRRTTCVEAVHGLGEALVSGLVRPDVYTVRDDVIQSRPIAARDRPIAPAPSGEAVAPLVPERRGRPALTDADVLRLHHLGRRIEALFAAPQDIEWCLVDDECYVLQSRPITTLYPLPVSDDGRRHVYISVGHQQMMTDAMTPLGLSFWQMTTPRPMAEAGGRLFVDVMPALASPAARDALLISMRRSDPLIADALETALARGDVVPATPRHDATASSAGTVALAGVPTSPSPDPSLVRTLIERVERSVAAVTHEIRAHTGPALFRFIRSDLQELRRLLFDAQSHAVVMAGIEATWWLNDHLGAWLGETNAADVLAQAAPHNVTSEMGMALLDVADAIRPHPAVVSFLRDVQDDTFVDHLRRVEGGAHAHQAILAWLDAYGMRGVGEIDIARPRWRERPRLLVPILLRHVDRFGAGESARRRERGRREAAARADALLARVRTLPDGDRKAVIVWQMIERVRAFIGYREFPKYGMICRYFLYKQALLAEAAQLVREGVLQAADDAFHLGFEELEDVVATRRVDQRLLDARREALRAHQRLVPPRVFTSDGETLVGAYRREDVPAGALVGLAVSAGCVEGRARVILDLADAELEPGDILVTRYTDPSWTALFVGIAGLVTEAGGLMTHGAVIAREYGVPAVVGVEQATHRIRDGQRIRLHGTHGYVELLS